MTSDVAISSGVSTDVAGSRIADFIEATADRSPEARALVVTSDRVALRYRDLVRMVDDLAGQLKRGGLLPGDRVALRCGSNAEFVVGLLAASRADLIAVPLDPALPVREQRARSEAVGARAVLIDGDGPGDMEEPDLPWWPIAVTVGRENGALAVHLDAATAPRQDFSTPEGLRDDDAMIMFTGGTTGVPKMVPWTRDNIADSVRAIVAGYGLGPQDATVAVMPRCWQPWCPGVRCCCPHAESFRRIRFGTTSMPSRPRGTRRCRRFTRSCWSGPKPISREANGPRCVSSAAAALRSPSKRRRPCKTRSPHRWCVLSA
jgi:non-ribosomal peptide synthetase component E (peptide arylation enzyme)